MTNTVKKNENQANSFIPTSTFNTYDEEIKQSGAEEEYGNYNKKEYMVQMFGINERGETASIFVEGFTPHFYIKVENDWNEAKKMVLLAQIKRDIGSYHEQSIVKASFISKRKLYGFDGGKNHTFILLKFNNESTMRKVKICGILQVIVKKSKEY